MEIKLFGKSLFKATKNELYWGQAEAVVKESKFLPDFYKLGDSNSFSSGTIMEFVPSDYAVQTGSKPKDSEPKAPEKKKMTPKGVFDCRLLHDKAFLLNTNTEYVDKQLADFKEKLALIKSQEYDMRHGVDEVSSVIIRMENRKKYATFQPYYEEFPYTKSSKIVALLKEQDYLKMGQVAQFVADMPKEAIEVMKSYNKTTQKLCGKDAVFYIIADKKDFEKTNTRRDPILLAQSPFGHFWQILGAWDAEMLFVEEL